MILPLSEDFYTFYLHPNYTHTETHKMKATACNAKKKKNKRS